MRVAKPVWASAVVLFCGLHVGCWLDRTGEPAAEEKPLVQPAPTETRASTKPASHTKSPSFPKPGENWQETASTVHGEFTPEEIEQLQQLNGVPIPIPGTAPRKIEPIPGTKRPVAWLTSKAGEEKLAALLRVQKGKAIVAGHPRYIFGDEFFPRHWQWLNPPEGAAFHTNQPYQAERFAEMLPGADRWEVKRYQQWSELKPKPGDVVHIRTNTALKPQQIDSLITRVKSGVHLLIQLEMEAREKKITEIGSNSAQLISKKLGVRFQNEELTSWQAKDKVAVVLPTASAKAPPKKPDPPKIPDGPSSKPVVEVPAEPPVVVQPVEPVKTVGPAKLIADFFLPLCPAPEGMEGHLVCQAMSPDGRWLAGQVYFNKIGNRHDDVFGGVGLWDTVKQGPPVVMRTPKSLEVWDLQFSPDGKWLSGRGSMKKEKDIRLYTWDVARQKLAWRSEDQDVDRFTWTDFGVLNVTDEEVRLISATDGKALAGLPMEEDAIRWVLIGAAYDAGSKTLYVATTRFIVVVDMETRREVRRILPTGEGEYIIEIALSADGRYIAASISKGAWMAWDAKSGRVITKTKGNIIAHAVSDLALIANSDRIWIQKNFHFEIHDLTQKEPTITVRPPAYDGEGFWTRSGRQLVLTEFDRVVIYDYSQAWGKVDGALTLSGEMIPNQRKIREWTKADGRRFEAKYIRTTDGRLVFQLLSDELGRNRERFFFSDMSPESLKVIEEIESRMPD